MRSSRDLLLAIVVGCVLAAGILVAKKIVDLTNQIQSERYQGALNACLDQNQRHGATVARLNELILRAELAQPRRRAAIRASEGSTLLLIDALAPYRAHCRVYATAVQEGHAS